MIAWAGVLAALAAVVRPDAVWLAGAALVGLVMLNAPLYRFFLRRGGPAFAAGAIALHALYLLYSSATFVGVAAHAAGPGRGRAARPGILATPDRHRES
jgi:hypothetical protein